MTILAVSNLCNYLMSKGPGANGQSLLDPFPTDAPLLGPASSSTPLPQHAPGNLISCGLVKAAKDLRPWDL